jgi:hypothetical protein
MSRTPTCGLKLLFAIPLICGVMPQAVLAAGTGKMLVRNIMALLSVFEQADALPPESSREANGLIHALIQTQAALTKSTDPATRLWFTEALRRAAQNGGDPILSDALTSRALEAILAHATVHPPGDTRGVLAGLQEFNVRQSDFDLMIRVFGDAKNRLTATGRDLHSLYEQERRAMRLQ